MEEQSIVEEFSEVIEGLLSFLNKKKKTKEPEVNLKDRKTAMMFKRAEDELGPDTHDLSVKDLRVASGLDKDPKSMYNQVAEMGNKVRAMSKFKAARKPLSKADVEEFRHQYEQPHSKELEDMYREDGSRAEYKSMKRHERKEAKRAKIKESLEALICSNLSESTKVEILESIRNYLAD